MLPKRRRFVVVVVAVPVVVAAFLSLILVPIPQHLSMHEVAVRDLATSCTGIETTKGTSVGFHWSAPVSISFGAWSCAANQLVYWGNGTSGSDTFVSQGGTYEFGTICPPTSPCWPANVSGTYTGPLLPL